MIVQTHLQNGMAGSVLAGGVVAQFANSFHFLGSFEGLGVIDNEKQVFVFLGEQTPQHIQCDLLRYGRLIPIASPEEFAVIGAMSTVSQGLDEPVDSAAMTDADRQHHRPEVAEDMFRNLPFDRLEKTLQFFWNFADCNHMATPTISICHYRYYRQSRPFLLDVFSNHKFDNRSV